MPTTTVYRYIAGPISIYIYIFFSFLEIRPLPHIVSIYNIITKTAVQIENIYRHRSYTGRTIYELAHTGPPTVVAAALGAFLRVNRRA